MDHASVAKLFSESLEDFYMQVDLADSGEELRGSSPNPSSEIPDGQPTYVASHSSQSQALVYESLDSQEDPRDHKFDDDSQEVSHEAEFNNGAVPLDEFDHKDARICETTISETHLDDVEFDDCLSVDSDATEVIEGGTRPVEWRGAHFPLHSRGYDINGRLPREAPRYQEVMDESPTQPNTQPYHDPRRHGTNSMLCEQDEADIIAILHPTSPSAHRAVSLTAEASTQHILQNHVLSQIREEGSDELALLPDGDGFARDIALRFSSKVNDLRNGFYFGRNPSNSDIILGGKPHKAISSRQFRIFLNHYGILMLEDTSTNGTLVDGIVLHGDRGTDHAENAQPKMTLHQGAMIEVPTTTSMHGETIRFVVNIPSRDIGQTRYNQNLTGYLQCINQAERRAAALEKAGANAADVIPVPTNTLPSGIREDVTPNASTYIATTGGNTHGMHWNGGTKYNVVSFLGSGAMAMVFKLSTKRDGKVYACKQLDKKRFLKSGIVGDKVYNELNIMKKLRHPYIVACTDQHETEAFIFIIMELVPHGDLGAYTTAGKLMPEHDAVVVARQMLDALEYLHLNGITHRDIKPENILVAAPFPWIFKLSDFGLAKVVKNDETFLKTFCGTLLYLAPEVYPGYPLVKSGKDPNPKRARDAPPVEPRPYRHSVDIWSLGAVLYQLLAAKPAWSGTSANNGAEFLVTVMTTLVDYERLIMIGNSHEAVAFISRMLVLDSRGRAREAELKDHPWLVSKPNPIDPNATIDAREELDASQLSLVDNKNEQDEDLEYDEDLEDAIADPRDPKRSRPTNWVGEEDEDLPDLYGNRVQVQTQHLPRSYFDYDTTQPLPPIGGPPPPRLFGEIGSSALQSSGVLGQNANAALEVAMEGSSDDEYAEGSSQNRLAGVSENTSAGYPNLPRTTVNTVRHPKKGVTQHSSQHPQTSSGPTGYSGDPSLLGAEELVGQLNMASMDSKAASPTTQIGHAISTTLNTSKRPSQSVDCTQVESATKRSKTGRVPASQPTARRSIDLRADDQSSASECSGKTAIGGATARIEHLIAGTNSQEASQDSNGAPRGLANVDHLPASKASTKAHTDSTVVGADSTNPSQDTVSSEHQDGQRPGDQGKSATPPPKTASNSQPSPHPSTTTSATNSITAPKAPSIRLPLTPSINLPPPPTPSPDGFIKPSICKLGTLFPTRGSIKTVPKIKITTMGTTFGRATDNKYVHPNPNELRVPKGAFDLQLWYPGMEKDLETGIDWTLNPNLSCYISTRTSRYIKVNGVRLMRGKDCWLYGKLRSGDVISVFELAEGQQAVCKADTEFLRFMCEFNIGGSRTQRKGEGERFVVLKEKVKFLGGRSREGSVVSDGRARARSQAGSPTGSAAATMGVGAGVSTTSAGGGGATAIGTGRRISTSGAG